jgi:hypothetical protein
LKKLWSLKTRFFEKLSFLKNDAYLKAMLFEKTGKGRALGKAGLLERPLKIKFVLIWNLVDILLKIVFLK